MKIKVKRVCISTPAAFEGTTDSGEYVFIRYRFGRFTLEIGEDLFTAQLGDRYDGYMTDEQLKDHMAFNGHEIEIEPEEELK